MVRKALALFLYFISPIFLFIPCWPAYFLWASADNTKEKKEKLRCKHCNAVGLTVEQRKPTEEKVRLVERGRDVYKPVFLVTYKCSSCGKTEERREVGEL
jgi:DNA-directed RNA polymerase subunit RPC12/RpoP